MQAKGLKAKLNIENYRQIFTALGAEWKETNTEYWQLRTGCHNKDWQDGSYRVSMFDGYNRTGKKAMGFRRQTV